MKSGDSGEWLERELLGLCANLETGLDLDADLISGLVSYCELASPQDAQEYLNNIVGQQAAQSVIEEYLQRRGYAGPTHSNPDVQNSKLQAYMKPPADKDLTSGTKRQIKTAKQEPLPAAQGLKNQTQNTETKTSDKGNSGISKKKKSGKVVSLAEAAKGSIVFQKGKPCSCQARRHKLVSNCLSCGKIVCEQEGEGPCSFCGALVLREGSSYAGLEDSIVPLSDSEVVAEAFAKRLVEYDRNAAARTTVIDDQSDYYEIEGNSWLSSEEKELIKKKQQEIEEADRARRNKVVVTFDLVGRKVLMKENEAQEPESEYRILRPPEEREINRIQPNPTIKIQAVFVDPGTRWNASIGKENRRLPNNLCLEVSGRVQHDGSELQRLMANSQRDQTFDEKIWKGPSVANNLHTGDDHECSPDYS